MSETNEIERLRSKRAELEAESRFLREKYAKLTCRVNALEEQATLKEMEDDIKTTGNAIINLESKVKMLNKKLKQEPQV
jgi:chromosome segregation ATPase